MLVFKKIPLFSFFIAIFTFLVFSNFIIYQTFIFRIPPYILWGLIFTLIISYKVLNQETIRVVFSGLLIWSIYYFFITSASFLFSIPDSQTFAIYRKIIISILALWTSFLIFRYDDNILTLTRKTIFYTMLFSVVLVIFDFLNPGHFIAEDNERFVAGRAAAMFLNPNIAGTALIISLILSIDLVSKQWRFLVISFVFIGVALTFSRASILGYVIVVFTLMIQRKIEFKKIILMTLIFLFSFTIFLSVGIDYLKKEGIRTENILGRISFLQTAGENIQDYSYYERKMILEKALNMFADNPFFGSGFAATRLWDVRVSAHNMYAVHWAEYGFFGMIILPLLFFVLYWKSSKEIRSIIILFIIFIIFRSIFTHNILDSYFILASIAIVMNLNLNSRRIHNDQK